MTEIKKNFIGGAWGAAADVVENRNPANPDDLVGVYARGQAADVAAAVLVTWATAFRRGLKAGMVMVNLPTAGGDCHVMFGGRGAWRRASTLWSGC